MRGDPANTHTGNYRLNIRWCQLVLRSCGLSLYCSGSNCTGSRCCTRWCSGIVSSARLCFLHKQKALLPPLKLRPYIRIKMCKLSLLALSETTTKPVQKC